MMTYARFGRLRSLAARGSFSIIRFKRFFQLPDRFAVLFLLRQLPADSADAMASANCPMIFDWP